MTNYVTVSDLIINGGEKCTILEKEPNVDYVTIEVTDYYTNVKKLLITHDNIEADVTEELVMKVMYDDTNMSPEKCVTVDDLNSARTMLFRNKMCSRCMYFQDYWASDQPVNSWHCGNNDNWANYKIGSCPEKLDGYEKDTVKITTGNTDGSRQTVLMDEDEEICRNLSNESFEDFMKHAEELMS